MVDCTTTYEEEHSDQNSDSYLNFKYQLTWRQSSLFLKSLIGLIWWDRKTIAADNLGCGEEQ